MTSQPSDGSSKNARMCFVGHRENDCTRPFADPSLADPVHVCMSRAAAFSLSGHGLCLIVSALKSTACVSHKKMIGSMSSQTLYWAKFWSRSSKKKP